MDMSQGRHSRTRTRSIPSHELLHHLAVVALLLGGLLSFSVTPQICFAQETTEDRASAKLEQILKKRGDLSLQDATMEKALIAIGATWNVNIVVGKIYYTCKFFG